MNNKKNILRYILCCTILISIFIVILSACINGQSNRENAYILLPASDENTNADNNAINISTSTLSYILPDPDTDGDISVENALSTRRSHRSYRNESISKEQLSQLLWAAYGITSSNNFRTAPSAGATYPLEIYAVIGDVTGIEPGLYRYIPKEHKIEQTISGDIRKELGETTFSSTNSKMIIDAPVTITYCAVFERTTGRYGERGRNYVFIELGHSAQNVYLQAEALGLGTCAIGAFSDIDVSALLQLSQNEEPIYLLPVGYISG